MIRESTEGEYSGIEHEVVPGVTESLKVCLALCCRSAVQTQRVEVTRAWSFYSARARLSLTFHAHSNARGLV